MSGVGTYWFSPAPSEITSSRLSLDFGLRVADLYFRELVVPELGRIWFTRQLSWPVAALALHRDLASRGADAPKPTAICHGIEALACKLEYLVDPQDPSRRILGRRAFGRDAEREVWSFRRLCQVTCYVRNTHRQAATRAISVEGGLGFARGSRFDLLELEPVGRALADALLERRVGRGGTSLRRWLLDWLQGEREITSRPTTLLQALSPEHPNHDECALVRSRLLGTSTSASQKRQCLALAIGRGAALANIEEDVVARLREAGHREQASEIVAARAFGAVLDRARDAVASITRAVESGRGGVQLTMLARDSSVRKSIKDLRAASKNYVERAGVAGANEATSRAFADAVVTGDDAEAVGLLVRRSGAVLGLADNCSSVTRGSLFRIVSGSEEASDLEDGAASIEPDRTGRTFRIANLHSLLRDVGQGGPR
jgi:hypothetical protein